MLDAKNYHCFNSKSSTSTETVHKQKVKSVHKFCLAYLHNVQHATAGYP